MAASRVSSQLGPSCSRSDQRRSGQHRWSARVTLMLMAVVAAAAPRASALKWEPGHLLTNYVDSSGSDFIRVLNSAGELLEDVSIAGGSRWTADDHVGWAVASYDGSRVIFVTTDSHSIYSVGIEAPHTVEYITTLPKQIKGVDIAEVHSLAVSPAMQLYAGVSTGCLTNSPHNCIGNYVVRYVLEDTAGKLRPTKVDAFPFVTHDLAMSLDGKILYGLDDPALSGGAKAIRQLNLTTMVPLPAFVVKSDSTCSALAAGGPQGPIVACHGEDHPINSEPAAIPKGGPARPVHSKRSNAVALATRLATNIKVNATYVWAYSPQSAAGAATLTKVNTSTGEAITKGLTVHVPSSLTALTVIPGTEPAADLPATQMVGRKFRRQLRGAASLLKAPRVRIHKLWD